MFQNLYAFIVVFCSILQGFCLNYENLSISSNINLVGSNGFTKKDDDNCEIVLKTFAFASANYTYCVISFARPIKLCQMCVESYNFVVKEYNDILNLNIEGGGKCKAKLLNLDRLQVVEAGFNYCTGLWTRASCNSCYEVDDKNNPTNELNTNTKEILRLSNLTETCIEQHRNDTSTNLGDPIVCSECKDPYQELNSRYETLKVDGFCMDIVDLINTTRAKWSTELGCCLDRKQPEWLFIVSSLVITCLPFAFYLAAFIFVSRKEHTVFRQRRLQEHYSSTATVCAVANPD